jgi:hypothetical protein
MPIRRRTLPLGLVLLALATGLDACRTLHGDASDAAATASGREIVPAPTDGPTAAETGIDAVMSAFDAAAMRAGALAGEPGPADRGLALDDHPPAVEPVLCCACIYNGYDAEEAAFRPRCDMYADTHRCAAENRFAVPLKTHDWTQAAVDSIGTAIAEFARAKSCTQIRIDNSDHSWASSQRPLSEICSRVSGGQLTSVTMNDRGCGFFAGASAPRYGEAYRQDLQRLVSEALARQEQVPTSFKVVGNQTYASYVGSAGSVHTPVTIEYTVDAGRVAARVLYPSCDLLIGKACSAHTYALVIDDGMARCNTGTEDVWAYCCSSPTGGKWQRDSACPVPKCSDYKTDQWCSVYTTYSGNGVPCWRDEDTPGKDTPTRVMRCEMNAEKKAGRWRVEPDADGDAVADRFDWCPGTKYPSMVHRGFTQSVPENWRGCAGGQSPLTAGPGVTLPETPAAQRRTADQDGDTVPDYADLCPGTSPGAKIELYGARAGCAAGQTPDAQVLLPAIPPPAAPH